VASTDSRALHIRYPRVRYQAMTFPLKPARRELSLRAILDKVTAIAFGLLFTLTFALGLERTIPHRSSLPVLMQALRADVVQAFARPAPPVVATKIETVVVSAERSMGPRALLARWQPLLLEASSRFAVPVDWIRAVMQAESGGRTEIDGKPIKSRAGALGLMQLLPETYREMRVRYRLGKDITNPHDNIMAGAAYLRWLHKRYGFPFMFAAYNAGPKQFERDVAMKRSLPAETRAYVSGILRAAQRNAQPEVAIVPIPRPKALLAEGLAVALRGTAG
jgi:membrane-bound lytic murein transglycosylase B